MVADLTRRADCGGIVLAGGRSQRMGTAKAALEWHGSTLAYRVAGILARATLGPVVVVRAPGQELPRLPADVEIAEDALEGRGPLQGIAAGLAALADRVQLAFVVAVDAPLLHPAFVRAICAALDDEDDVALPVIDGRRQPLAAAYRTALHPLAAEVAAGERRGTAELFARCRVRELEEGLLPWPQSATGVNDAAAYAAARALPPPLISVAGGEPVRAATLGALRKGRPGRVARVDGAIVADPDFPLVEGDEVSLAGA